MLLIFVVSLVISCSRAEDKEADLLRLTEISAAEAFIDSAEVVIIGFFEKNEGYGYKEFLAAVKEVKNIPAALSSDKEVWAKYSINLDTISVFRKADLHQENLNLSKTKNLDTEGVVRFFTINNIHYMTEYTQVSAVGLFQSKVKVHLLLFANRGTDDYIQLKERLEALAPQYAGKMLFILINGKEADNARALKYFSLKSSDLPRVGLYHAESDRSWLMMPGEITTERVQNFCDSFLSGKLQGEKKLEESDAKSEL